MHYTKPLCFSNLISKDWNSVTTLLKVFKPSEPLLHAITFQNKSPLLPPPHCASKNPNRNSILTRAIYDLLLLHSDRERYLLSLSLSVAFLPLETTAGINSFHSDAGGTRRRHVRRKLFSPSISGPTDKEARRVRYLTTRERENSESREQPINRERDKRYNIRFW